MTEIFKDIPGYEGLYQVSNLGNVKSLNYRRSGKEKIIKPRKKSKSNTTLNKYYYCVALYKDKKRKNFRVHHLVAEAFINNPNNYPVLNHLDKNPENNCVENLEWCTQKYNVQYSVGKPIKCLDLKTNEITYYPSINEASKQLNTSAFAIWYNIYKSKSPYRNMYIFEESK